MKTLTASLLMIVFSTEIFSQTNSKNDLQKSDLRDNVKSLHETFYKADRQSGKIVDGKKINNWYDKESQIEFNKDGYKIFREEFNDKGQSNQNIKFIYDDKYICIREEKYNSDNTLINSTNFIYKYNSDNKIIEENWVRNNKQYHVVYNYSSGGDILQKSWYEEGKEYLNIKYLFDKNGNMIESLETNSDGTPSWRITYSLNDTGKVLEETWFKKGRKFFIKYVYEYDSRGNKSSISWANAKGKIFAKWNYQSEYDEHNNWTRTVETNPKKAGIFSSRDENIIERQIQYY